MLRSPLILGANLTKLDDWTMNLLTNRDVLDVDQNSHGGRQVNKDAAQAVWMSKPDKGAGLYLAVFNLSDTQKQVTYPLQSIGGGKTDFDVRELWDHKSLGSLDVLKVSLPPHGCGLYRLQ